MFCIRYALWLWLSYVNKLCLQAFNCFQQASDWLTKLSVHARCAPVYCQIWQCRRSNHNQDLPQLSNTEHSKRLTVKQDSAMTQVSTHITVNVITQYQGQHQLTATFASYVIKNSLSMLA